MRRSISFDISGEIRVHMRFEAQGNRTQIDVWGNKSGTLSANGIQLHVFSNDHKFFDLTGRGRTPGPRAGRTSVTLLARHLRHVERVSLCCLI